MSEHVEAGQGAASDRIAVRSGTPDARTEAGACNPQVEIIDGDISLDAALLGELLNVAPVDIPALMRDHAITSFCERGIDAHQGEFRLSFFYQNRRVRVNVDTAGRILLRSINDFGQHPLPRALHRGGD